MRMIHKKRWGFVCQVYPIDNEDGQLAGFKVGIYDDNKDLWWFSDDTVKNAVALEAIAMTGWRELLEDFMDNHDEFPDRTQVIDVRSEIRAEIDSAKFRLDQLASSYINEEVPDVRQPIGVQSDGSANERDSTGGRPEAPDGGVGDSGVNLNPEEATPTEEVQPSSVPETAGEGASLPEEGLVDGQDSSKPEHEHISSKEIPREESRKHSSNGESKPRPKAHGDTSKSEDKSKGKSKSGSNT